MYAKLIVFLCFLTIVVARVKIPAELQEFINDLHNGCVQKIGITEEEHKAYVIGNKDPKMMCYMKCLLLDSKWMSPDGVIQYDFITNNAHPDVKDVLVAAINKCREIPEGTHECEKSYNFHECMSKADPENWLLV